MPNSEQIRKRKEQREKAGKAGLDLSLFTEDIPSLVSGDYTPEIQQNIDMVNQKSLLGNIDRIVKDNETPFGEGKIADVSKDVAVFGYSPLKKLFSSGAHPASRIARGTAAGFLEAINQGYDTFIDDPSDFISTFVGIPDKNDSDLIDIKALGFERPSDKLYWTYNVPKVITNLVAPGIGIYSALGKIDKIQKFAKTSKKAKRLSELGKGSLSSGLVEGILSDPDEGTIIDTVFDMFDVHPSLENPVLEFLRHPQVDDVDPDQTTRQEILQRYENRLRKGTVGLLEDPIFDRFLGVLKGIKESPSLMKKMSRRMSARPDLHPSLDDAVGKVIDVDFSLKTETPSEPVTLITDKPLPERLQNASSVFKFRKKIEGAKDLQAETGTGTAKGLIVNNVNLTFENDIAKALYFAGSKNKKQKVEAIQYLNSIGVKNSEELGKEIQTNLKLAGEGGITSYNVKVPSTLTKKGKQITTTGEKVETTFNPKYIGDGSQESFINYILTQADDLKNLESAGNWPYKRTFKDMIEDASKYTPREVIEAAVRFNKRYGTGGQEDLPAILISMNQFVNTTGRNLYDTATQLDQALATGNLKGYDQLKEPFAKELQVFRSLMLLNKNLKTIPAQTLAANKAAGGFAESAATLDDLTRRTPTEKAIDQQQRIMATPDVDDPLPDLPVDELIKMADEGDTKGLRKLVRLIQASNGDPKVLRKMNDGWGWLRGGNEIFINNILSNPETHLVNIGSTALNTLAGPIELFLANPLDAETRARAGFELYYMMSTFSDSMRLASKAFQIEDNIVNPASMVQDAERFAVRVDSNHSAAALVNGLGTAIRIPSRFLLAEDELFKQINFRGYIGGKNRYNGMMKNLTGKDLDNYVNEQNEILFNAIETGSRKGIVSKQLNDLLEEAQAYAAERTFTAPLKKGSLSGKISDLAQHPLGRVFFPFVRTPINLLKQTAYRTPGVNLFLDEYRQKLLSTDKAVKQRAIGQMYMGGAMWTGGLAMAVAHDDPYAELAITGGGPKNFKLLEQKIADGWQPYSFRFLMRDPETDEIIIENGKPKYRYVSFQRFDPWSSFLTMSADFASISGHISEEERETLVNVMAVTAVRNLNNKTYLRGFTEINDLFNNPRKFERWVARRISDNINIYPALTREIKRGARYNVRHDKRVRGEEGFKLFKEIYNQYTENTPFLKGDNPPIRHQRTGRYKTYPAGYGVNDFNPVYQSTSHNNPLLMIENELEIILPDMKETLRGGTKLDNEQYAELVDLKLSVLRPDGRGNNVGVQQALINVINTPKFQINLQKFRGFDNAEEIHQRLVDQGFKISLKEVKENAGTIVKENARDEMYDMLKIQDDIYKGLAINYFKEKYPLIKKKYDKQRHIEKLVEKEVSRDAIQRMFTDSSPN